MARIITALLPLNILKSKCVDAVSHYMTTKLFYFYYIFWEEKFQLHFREKKQTFVKNPLLASLLCNSILNQCLTVRMKPETREKNVSSVFIRRFYHIAQLCSLQP